MVAAKQNIVIEQGTTFIWVVTTTEDLTDRSARMQIRSSVGAEDPLVDISTTTGEIVIAEEAGTITITIDSEATAAMTWTSGVYDLEIFTIDDPEVVSRLKQGYAYLSKQVTR